jgi:CheY-like chemotaxis protein
MPFAHLGYPPGFSPIARERVLVIDDSRVFRLLIQDMLRKLGCAEVMSAESPELGIEILKRKRCGLLILDYEMPLLNGAELAQLLRSDPKLDCAEAGIVLVTPYNDEARIKNAMAKGVDTVLTKPFAMIDLARRIDYVQKKRVQAQAAVAPLAPEALPLAG